MSYGCLIHCINAEFNKYFSYILLVSCNGRRWLVWFMVFNDTFNNISFIWWRSVLLVEKTGGNGENDRPVVSHWQTLSHNVVSSTGGGNHKPIVSYWHNYLLNVASRTPLYIRESNSQLKLWSQALCARVFTLVVLWLMDN